MSAIVFPSFSEADALASPVPKTKDELQHLSSRIERDKQRAHELAAEITPVCYIAYEVKQELADRW